MVFIHINDENTHVFNLFNPFVSFFDHFAGLLSFWPVGQWLQLPDFASFGCGGTTWKKHSTKPNGWLCEESDLFVGTSREHTL